MSFSLTLLDLAGFVALLLWGVRMVQTGVQRAFGARLRLFLSAALGDRLRGFLAGIGVTALLQSSTAVALMASGFAAAGLVDLVPALGVTLGAGVGSTLIVQLLSLHVAAAAPALILVGVVAFRRGQETRWRDLGRVAIGLGLVLLALQGMFAVIAPLERMSGLRGAMSALAGQDILALLLAAALAWAAHSSVTVVLLVMQLAAAGVMPLTVALAMTLGANLGTAINPWLETPAGDAAAHRLPLGNLGFRVCGCIIALPFLAPIADRLATMNTDPARAVANFHSLFNLALAVLFLPLLSPWAAGLCRLLPARPAADDPRRPRYLDAGPSMPVVAIGAAAREALRLADVLEQMLAGLLASLEKVDRKRIAPTRRLDDVLDSLNRAIRAHLAALHPQEMTEADHRRVAEILSFATNLENAGDVVERELLPRVSRLIKRNIAFSADELAELVGLVRRLVGNLRAAAVVFMSDDARAARLLAAEKQAFRDIEARATAANLARLRTLKTGAGAAHLDLIRGLKRVNAHLVAAAAYPVLASRGELLESAGARVEVSRSTSGGVRDKQAAQHGTDLTFPDRGPEMSAVSPVGNQRCPPTHSPLGIASTARGSRCACSRPMLPAHCRPSSTSTAAPGAGATSATGRHATRRSPPPGSWSPPSISATARTAIRPRSPTSISRSAGSRRRRASCASARIASACPATQAAAISPCSPPCARTIRATPRFRSPAWMPRSTPSPCFGR